MKTSKQQSADSKQYAMPTTGDPVKDQQAFDDFERHSQAMDAGLCPNACGPLTPDPDDSRDLQCKVCGFHFAQRTISTGALRSSLT